MCRLAEASTPLGLPARVLSVLGGCVYRISHSHLFHILYCLSTGCEGVLSREVGMADAEYRLL